MNRPHLHRAIILFELTAIAALGATYVLLRTIL